MAYIQEFAKLLEATFKLTEILDDHYNRFDITANFTNSNNLSTLELWIKRVDIVLNCKTEWIEERDVFQILVNELKTFPKGEEEKKGTMILIGALLHRYFRLIHKYENNWAYSLSSPLYCNLFKAIREVLQLEPNVKSTKFKELDLEILDVMTIVSALTMFRDYMLIKDDVGIIRYSKYQHFKTDPEFITQLNKIITQYISIDKAKNKFPIINQFKAIRFIQSLANILKSNYLELEKGLNDWMKSLEKDHPDFSMLDFETLKKHLTDKVKSETIKQSIVKFLISERIQEQLKPDLREKNQDEFQSPLSSEEEGIEKIIENKEQSQVNFILDYKTLANELLSAAYDYSRNVLFGGYALLLQSNTIPTHLKNMLNEAVTGNKSQKNNAEDLKEGVKMLADHINAHPKLQLDWSFFGGKKGYNQLLSKVKYEEEDEPASAKNESFVASI